MRDEVVSFCFNQHQTVGWAKQGVPIATMRFSQSTNLSDFGLPNFALTITLPSLYPHYI